MDALYGVFIKEMAEVPTYLKLHPMTTLLANDTVGLSGDVAMSDQELMALHCYTNDPDQYGEGGYVFVINRRTTA